MAFRFARNLKPEQISVEVLRGKGELKNIVLNEDVLSEKLELPPWFDALSKWRLIEGQRSLVTLSNGLSRFSYHIFGQKRIFVKNNHF